MAISIRVLMLLALVGCIQCKVLKLSCQHIRTFVAGHNYRRGLLAKGKVSGQPAASKMKAMIWDHELAAKAEKWVSKYRQYHNPDRKVGSGRFSTGENLYFFSTTDHNANLSLISALNTWFNEYKYYTYEPLSQSNYEQIEHYTQMAWSNSTYLGCAVSQFYEDGWNKFMVACNYGPAGNLFGMKPYNSGQPSLQLICTTGDCRQRYGDQCSRGGPRASDLSPNASAFP